MPNTILLYTTLWAYFQKNDDQTRGDENAVFAAAFASVIFTVWLNFTEIGLSELYECICRHG